MPSIFRPVPRPVSTFSVGAVIGALGGLVGLSGAEFRLPFLTGTFRYNPVEAAILNKALSFLVIAVALPFRSETVPLAAIWDHWPLVAALLAGSLAGAWSGGKWAKRLKSRPLSMVIASLLLLTAIMLAFGHGAKLGQAIVIAPEDLVADVPVQLIAGVIAGLLVGLIASVLSVAGGELLIPTLMPLFGADIKLAGSLTLAISLPTMLAGLPRYFRDKSWPSLKRNLFFLLIAGAGTLAGTYFGGRLLGHVSEAILIPALAFMLSLSAIKVWQNG